MSRTNNHSDINQTFIISAPEQLASSGCTNVYTNRLINCENGAVIYLGRTQTIFNTNIVPETTDFIVLGTPLKRFRDINVMSGTTSVWAVTEKVKTPTLALGLDANGENREINAQNSIIQYDSLNGGEY
jgi:hypothetical protein